MVSERKIQGEVKVQEIVGQPTLVHINEGNQREIDRRTHMGINQKVTENRLKEIELRPSVSHQQRNINVNAYKEQAIVNER